MTERLELIDPSIDDKWRIYLALAGSGDERDIRNAQRFALIHAFGDETKFHFDAEFHARVCLAENMLMVLEEVTT